jgi:hypothetical protein
MPPTASSAKGFLLIVSLLGTADHGEPMGTVQSTTGGIMPAARNGQATQQQPTKVIGRPSGFNSPDNPARVPIVLSDQKSIAKENKCTVPILIHDSSRLMRAHNEREQRFSIAQAMNFLIRVPLQPQLGKSRAVATSTRDAGR